MNEGFPFEHITRFCSGLPLLTPFKDGALRAWLTHILCVVPRSNDRPL